MSTTHPPLPIHIKGTPRGEERVRDIGKEPGRKKKNVENYRLPRDSTSINPDHAAPIDPRMPSMPPS